MLFQFKCCGIDNQTDWYRISAWPDKENVPTSCCIIPTVGCGDNDSQSPIHDMVIIFNLYIYISVLSIIVIYVRL